MSRDGAPLVGGEARGVENLDRADFAEPQMRGEPRGRGFVGPVALVGIARDVVQEIGKPFARGPFAGRPAFAQAAGPVGFRGLEMPVIQPVGDDAIGRRQAATSAPAAANAARRATARASRTA